jgi:hypothetical protein
MNVHSKPQVGGALRMPLVGNPKPREGVPAVVIGDHWGNVLGIRQIIDP